jgi:O-acetyl-ADP-ribose deacetylase (regulator of RNase III)
VTEQITYVVGDATQPQGDGVRIIAHVCNNRGGWGRGFVVALSRRNGNPKDCYRKWYAEGVYEFAPFELGQVQLASFTEPDVMVANMIAQDGIRHDPSAPPAIDYKALRLCLDNLGKEATRWHAATGRLPSIHMPRIGCGLGGGNWAQVEEIILESLVDIYGLSVTVYDLDNSEGDS